MHKHRTRQTKYNEGEWNGEPKDGYKLGGKQRRSRAQAPEFGQASTRVHVHVRAPNTGEFMALYNKHYYGSAYNTEPIIDPYINSHNKFEMDVNDCGDQYLWQEYESRLNKLQNKNNILKKKISDLEETNEELRDEIGKPIPITITFSSDKVECIICCDEYVSGEKLYAYAPCYHIFHQACFLDWEQNSLSNSCPICSVMIRV